MSPPLTILNSRHVTDTKQKEIQNTNKARSIIDTNMVICEYNYNHCTNIVNKNSRCKLLCFWSASIQFNEEGGVVLRDKENLIHNEEEKYSDPMFAFNKYNSHSTTAILPFVKLRLQISLTKHK